MSKYIELDDAINKLDEWFCEPYTPTELLSDLPTIEVSEDCISREYMKSLGYINKGDFNSVETIREWIDNAPSVVPTQTNTNQCVESVGRAEGEWIDCDSDSNIYDDIRCSICGMKFTVDIERKTDIGFTITDLKFCPNCGAKMKG